MARRKNIDWPTIFTEQKKSGKSIAEFCKGKKIHPNTFYRARKLKNQSEFVEIKSPGAQASAGRIVITRKGYTIEISPGFSTGTLKELLEVIG